MQKKSVIYLSFLTLAFILYVASFLNSSRIRAHIKIYHLLPLPFFPTPQYEAANLMNESRVWVRNSLRFVVLFRRRNTAIVKYAYSKSINMNMSIDSFRSVLGRCLVCSCIFLFVVFCFLRSPTPILFVAASECMMRKKIKKIRIRIYAHSTLADANVFFLVYLCESSFLHGRRNCLSVMSPRRPSLLSYSILENTELSVFQSNLCMEIKCRKICCLSPIQINN